MYGALFNVRPKGIGKVWLYFNSLVLIQALI